MAVAQFQDVVSLQLEAVAPMFEELFGMVNVMESIIGGSAEDVTVSEYGYRIPLQTMRAGASSKVDTSASGSYPVGSGGVFAHMTAGWHNQARSIRFADIQRDTTGGGEQAIIDYVNQTIAGAMEGIGIDNDILMHTNGTGVLTNPCSSPAASGSGATTATMTFAAASDKQRLNLLVGCEGASVEVWSEDLATKRTPTTTTQPVLIVSLQPFTGVVTFSQTVTGVCPSGSQDRLVFPGMAIGSPATPTSFSSTWPARGGTIGLGGDSFVHGLPYFNDNSTSNYCLGLSKGTYRQLLASGVAAAGATINWSHGRQMTAQILARWGSEGEAPIGFAHTAQIEAITNLTITISQVMGNEVSAPVDLGGLTPKLGTPVPYCGMMVYKDPRQPADRVDFTHRSGWVKPKLFNPGFLAGGDSGQYLFRGRSSSGTPTAYFDAVIRQAYDYAQKSPGKGGMITGLAVTAGYGFD